MSDVEETTGAELVLSRGSREVDMRSPVTDSWTDVLHDAVELARGIAATEFVPKSIRCKCPPGRPCGCGGVAKTTASVLYSRELGLPPMTGLGSTHVIEGTAGISAEMMRALILQAGHELQITESTRERCSIRGRRAGQEEWTTSTWTIQEAQQTKVFLSKDKGWGPLAAKSQWLSWPTEMLLARATTRLARMIFPDVIHGMRSVEELQDVSEDAGEPPAVVVESVQPQPVGRKRVARSSSAAPAAASSGGAPSRARVGRPAPKSAPASEPVRRDPEPSVSEPVDAVLVDDEPATTEAEAVEQLAEAVAEAPMPPNAIKPGQRNQLQAQFARLGIDREERLMWLSMIAAREIGSANELTVEEASAVLGVVEKCRDREALEAWGRERDEAQPTLGGEPDGGDS